MNEKNIAEYLHRKIGHTCRPPDATDLFFIIKYIVLKNRMNDDIKKEIEFIMYRPVVGLDYQRLHKMEKDLEGLEDGKE